MLQGNIHFPLSKVSKGAGHSAVERGAYITGQSLYDDKLGQYFTPHAREKERIAGTGILIPDGVEAPACAASHQALWNAVQDRETHKKALYAREFEASLPHEVTAEARERIVLEQGQFMADRYKGLLAYGIHKPHETQDQRNHHVHYLLTARPLEKDGSWNKDKRTPWDFKDIGEKEMMICREHLANLINREYKRAGLEHRVDHRSYAERGIDKEPGVHLGPKAAGMERRGEESDRGNLNRAAADRNRAREAWQKACEKKFGTPQPGEPPRAMRPPLLRLIDGQREERAALVRVHVQERAEQWHALQDKKQAHKAQWKAIYARQKAEITAIKDEKKGFEAANASVWAKTKRKLSVTAQTRYEKKLRGFDRKIKDLEAQHKRERAQVGQRLKTERQQPIQVLQRRHKQELQALDGKHQEQRDHSLQRLEMQVMVEERQHRQMQERERDKGRDIPFHP